MVTEGLFKFTLCKMKGVFGSVNTTGSYST